MSNQEQIDAIIKSLVLNIDQLKSIRDKILEQMIKGLNPQTKNESSLKMVPTYVRYLPTGTEKGKFLALDLGGTNFRVLLISLNESNSPKKFDMEFKTYPIDKKLMVGHGNDLFDYIAECLQTFINSQKVAHLRLPLGFTFSFPCYQESLTNAKLIHWTKGFTAAGVVGENVVALLEHAMKRRGVDNIEVTAILNDTTGTLMSCAFLNPLCEVGLILGTGTNACYVEKLDDVHTWTEVRDNPNQVLINTEWGAFGDKNELDPYLTEFDREMDNKSLNPGKQLYEKLISGMYLGRIAGLVIQKLTKKGLLFSGVGSPCFTDSDEFSTKTMSEIESEPVGIYNVTQKVLIRFGINHVTDDDCKVVRQVCETVSTRAAHLSSAGVATLINRIGKPFLTIGVDGSVFRHYPRFQAKMKEKISHLIEAGKDFQLMESEDGSGIGAALVAAVASGCTLRKI